MTNWNWNFPNWIKEKTFIGEKKSEEKIGSDAGIKNVGEQIKEAQMTSII